MELENLAEELRSNLNRVKIALVLVETGNVDLLPTALEDLLYYVQEIVERHCIVGE